MRYIIELQALCAKELANQSKNMTKHERYNFLKNIPKHLLVYVKYPIYSLV